MTGDLVTSGHHMREQGQPRPPRDDRPDTDMCADGLWFARPGSARQRRLTQSVADPVPVANLTLTQLVLLHYLGNMKPGNFVFDLNTAGFLPKTHETH